MNLHTLNAPHGAQLSRETLELTAGDIVRLKDAQGISIFVRAGTAWITQHGDQNDVVIGAGETFVIDRPGLALLTRIHGATVVISALPERARACWIERVQCDGSCYPVLSGRPQPAPTGGSRLAPAF